MNNWQDNGTEGRPMETASPPEEFQPTEASRAKDRMEQRRADKKRKEQRRPIYTHLLP